MIFFLTICDLWQDDERNLERKHDWLSEDTRSSTELEDELEPGVSFESENEQEPGPSFESRDEQGLGPSTKFDEELSLEKSLRPLRALSSVCVKELKENFDLTESEDE